MCSVEAMLSVFVLLQLCAECMRSVAAMLSVCVLLQLCSERVRSVAAMLRVCVFVVAMLRVCAFCCSYAQSVRAPLVPAASRPADERFQFPPAHPALRPPPASPHAGL